MSGNSNGRFKGRVNCLVWESAGATGIEYAVIAALIGFALLGSMSVLGQGMTGMYSKVAVALEGSPDVPVPKGLR